MSTTAAFLFGLSGMLVGTSLLVHSYRDTPIVRRWRNVGRNAKRERMRETRALVLTEDTKKRYQFPPASYSEGQAFQFLCVTNSDVPLVIVSESDKRDSKGYVEVTFTIPHVDSWTRLQRHLDPLQSVLCIGHRPTLTVHNDKLVLRCVYHVPEPTWLELTPYLPSSLNGGTDTVSPYLGGYQRFRITGGSEAGKSPTAKNIALHLAEKYGTTARLSNPQSYSNKNYWGNKFDVVARTHTEQYELILQVAHEVITRGTSNGHKPYEVYIFDELDSTVAFLDMKELKELKAAILMIIKQASHQNICVLFLGQTSAANLIPGTTKSDWMSLVTVAIGSTGYDAISKSVALTSKRKAQLTERYEFTMRKAQQANKNNPNKATWLRPAIVFDPTSVEIVVLPPFS